MLACILDFGQILPHMQLYNHVADVSEAQNLDVIWMCADLLIVTVVLI